MEKDVLLVLDKQQGKVSAVKGINKEVYYVWDRRICRHAERRAGTA